MKKVEFKLNDDVFYPSQGWGKVTSVTGAPTIIKDYPIEVKINGSGYEPLYFMADGKYKTGDKNRTLFSKEEAIALGAELPKTREQELEKIVERIMDIETMFTVPNEDFKARTKTVLKDAEKLGCKDWLTKRMQSSVFMYEPVIRSSWGMGL